MRVVHESPVMSAKSLDDVALRDSLSAACQCLAEAHRMIDGKPGMIRPLFSKMKVEFLYQWVMPSEHHDFPFLPLVASPDSLWSRWTRANRGNYMWMFFYFEWLSAEFTHRFGFPPSFVRWRERLQELPRQMCVDRRGELPVDIQEERLAIQKRSARWTRRAKPEWWLTAIESPKVTTTETGLLTGSLGPTISSLHAPAF